MRSLFSVNVCARRTEPRASGHTGRRSARTKFTESLTALMIRSPFRTRSHGSDFDIVLRKLVPKLQSCS